MRTRRIRGPRSVAERTRIRTVSIVAFAVSAALVASTPSAAAPSSGAQAPTAGGAAIDTSTDSARSADGSFFARSLSMCGRVYIQHAFLGSVSSNVGRLPARVSLDNPFRAVPNTDVFTYTTAEDLQPFHVSSWYFVSDPSGTGPGFNVTVSWAGHHERIVTDPYVDNCSGTYFAARPTRVLDTRTGIGRGGTVGKVAAGATISVDATSPGSIPDDYVTGVVLNVTATNPDAAGYLTVHPCNAPTPRTSSLNFVAGQTVPNMVQLDLIGYPEPGNVCVFTSAETDVLVDVAGYYRNHEDPNPIGAALTPFATPKRILDTRAAVPVDGGTVYRLDLAGRFGVPVDATAVSVNLTATEARANGYLTSYPCGEEPPDASNVNYVPGKSTANATLAGVGDGAICIFSSSTTHLLVDLNGYFDMSGGTRFLPRVPERVLDSRPIRLPARTPYRVYIPAPLSGATVALNVTVTDPLTDGYLAVYPCDQELPDVSNINFAAHDTVANAVVTRTDPDRYVCLWSSTETYFIVDMNGYASLQDRFGVLN